jgi:hypothetical protein
MLDVPSGADSLAEQLDKVLRQLATLAPSYRARAWAGRLLERGEAVSSEAPSQPSMCQAPQAVEELGFSRDARQAQGTKGPDTAILLQLPPASV